MDGLFEATLYGDAWMISWIYYLMLVGWRDSFGNGNLPPPKSKMGILPRKTGVQIRWSKLYKVAETKIIKEMLGGINSTPSS